MAVVNPFADDPERGAVWEQGYDAGFSEPEEDHLPPLEPELLDVFQQGERTGRDDRRNEPNTQDPLPDEASEDFTRFESAPDGTLIPIPSEAPEGNTIRDDATATVTSLPAGFYVVIYNGPPERADEFGHFVTELVLEENIALLEKLLAVATRQGVPGLIHYGGLFISVAISLFTPSPILKETRYRGYLPGGTPIAYVILDPQ